MYSVIIWLRFFRYKRISGRPFQPLPLRIFIKLFFLFFFLLFLFIKKKIFFIEKIKIFENFCALLNIVPLSAKIFGPLIMTLGMYKHITQNHNLYRRLTIILIKIERGLSLLSLRGAILASTPHQK